MLVAAGLTIFATPNKRLADTRPKLELEGLIPESFSGWTIDRSVAPLMVSPDLQAQLDKVYNQTLARTYVNPRGQRVMLSVAYGGNQFEGMQTHVPEVCYPAQGFELLKSNVATIASRFGSVAGKQAVFRSGRRVEPVTYWMTVGEKVARTGVTWKLAQLRYGLTGVIPDGMLIRVSNISSDELASFELHKDFIDGLLDAVDPNGRTRLIGRPAV